MGKLRYQFPAELNIADRMVGFPRTPLAQLTAQPYKQLSDASTVYASTQAERIGYVIRHQQLPPVADPWTKTSLYCGDAFAGVPVVVLHVAIPDTVPPFVLSEKVTDHVASSLLEVVPPTIPSTDGSKIMDVCW